MLNFILLYSLELFLYKNALLRQPNTIALLFRQYSTVKIISSPVSRSSLVAKKILGIGIGVYNHK